VVVTIRTEQSEFINGLCNSASDLFCSIHLSFNLACSAVLSDERIIDALQSS
jgi:hypothetical protein